MALFVRVLVIFALSFAMFKDRYSPLYISDSDMGPAIVAALAFSLLLLPLPYWALSPCRNKHFLSRGSDDNDDSEDEEEEEDSEEEHTGSQQESA